MAIDYGIGKFLQDAKDAISHSNYPFADADAITRAIVASLPKVLDIGMIHEVYRTGRPFAPKNPTLVNSHVCGGTFGKHLYVEVQKGILFSRLESPANSFAELSLRNQFQIPGL